MSFTQVEIRRVQTSVNPAPKTYEFQLDAVEYGDNDVQATRLVNLAQVWRLPVWTAQASLVGGSAAYFAQLQTIYLAEFGWSLVDVRDI